MVSILDYHPEDPSYLNATDRTIRNITSKYGANIADPIIQAFGYTIILPLILFTYWSVMELLSRGLKKIMFRISLLLLTFPAFCLLVSFFDNNMIMDGNYYTFHLGGYLGYFLKTELMVSQKISLSITFASAICILTLLFEFGLIERFIIRFQSKDFSDIGSPIRSQEKKLKLKNFIDNLFKRNQHSKQFFKTEENIITHPEINFTRDTTQNSQVFDIKSFDFQNSINDLRNKPQDIFSTEDNDSKVDLILQNPQVVESQFDFKTEKISEQQKPFDFIIPNNSIQHGEVKRSIDSFTIQTTKKPKDVFILPSTNILHSDKTKHLTQITEDEINQNKSRLLGVLNDFGIRGEITEVFHGPVVTLYALEPVSGTKSSRVIGLADDIARSMRAKSARVAVIQGKNAIGIELPNDERQIISLKEVLESHDYQSSEHQLPIALGKNISGEIVVVDLAKMPHLLVAGTTGSGKSVAIHSMILSLLYKYGPDECKFIMIDPKMLEMSVYAGIAHLLAPVVTTPETAVATMKWIVKEMEARYRAMSVLGVRNIVSYNNLMSEAQNKKSDIEKQVQVGFNSETKQPIFESIVVKAEILPYIVVIIDEMADLMAVAGKDIETSVQRLAQMARAAGIHLIMATQRPSVDVITGVIKANFPTRISFQVASKFDSRTILGEMGAEQLLGAGDMLYMMPGGKIERIHGAYVTEEDVEKVVNHIKTQRATDYLYSVLESNNSSEQN